MSSVQDRIECPQCNHHADYILDTRSREEWTQCAHCGYFREVTLAQSKVGSQKCRVKHREKLGFGTARYQRKDHIGFARFSLYKNKRGSYVQWVLNNADSLSFASMTIQQEDGHWREVVLLGKVPSDEPFGDDLKTSNSGVE